MNEELRKKIEADLVKAGFYFEMQTIKTFLSCGWHCFGGTGYFDKDEGKTREIDLVAKRYYSASSQHPGLHPSVEGAYEICGEVKKSERPWLIFKQPKYGFKGGNLATWHLPFDEYADFKENITDLLAENSLGTKLGWFAYGMHEAFKKPDMPSRWYSAFIAVSKCAYEWKIIMESDEIAEWKRASGSLTIYWVKPVVILAGELIAVELDSEGNMCIDEIEAATARFSFATSNYPRYSYSIDIITLNYLESYIKLSEQWLRNVCDSIYKDYLDESEKEERRKREAEFM